MIKTQILEAIKQMPNSDVLDEIYAIHLVLVFNICTLYDE